MRSEIRCLRLLLAILLLPLSLVAPVQADQADATQQSQKPGLRIVKALPIKVSQPLRSQISGKAAATNPSAALTFQDRRLIIPKTLTSTPKIPKTSSALAAAAVVESKPIGSAMPTADASFEGIPNVSGVLPPDTQGDIGWDPASGKKYYVQWVNLAYQIWDVTNPAAPISLVGPVAGNTLWSGTGGLCDTHNDGDPLTRFDHLSKRWVMSQFALSFPNDFHQCVAVSASADPTGAWYLYDFQTSTTLMNDYGKLGIWPDGYYMSFNQFDGTTEAWRGAGVAVFERDKMLLGQAARMVYIDTGAVTLNYGGMLPADLDGPAPPAGTPNYFMEWDDSSWLGDASDTLRVWEFRTDWSNPANTSFGLNASYDPNLKIATANGDPNVCAPGVRNCIPQPDTAQGLDAMSDRLMYRLQYRNFGSHQTIVGNHSVDANGAGLAGIDWFELRNTGTGFAMYQEGTYAPDSDNRWMGSAAMDASGNIGLGYSVASSSTYPSVRYGGRLAGDPLGTLPQGEQTLINGSGSQTHTAARWGDYSMLAIDPADGCTFWYTQEYMQTTGSSNWQTRIGAFRFPSCTTAPTGILSGTISDSKATPIAGASIKISGGYTTTSDASGQYSISLASGTYSITVSKYGYGTVSAPAVDVTPPGTTTSNFTLVTAPTATVSGVVRDATTSWPLYARIEIAGYPGSPIFTNPATGLYHVVLAEGSYPVSVTAMSGGYSASSQLLSVTGDATRNMTLTANTLTCSAPGYQIIPGSIISSNGFDTATVPAFSDSWAQEPMSGSSASWVSATTSEHPSGIVPHSGSTMAVFNSWTAAASDSNRLYLTNDMDLSAQSSGEVSFWMYHESEFSAQDTMQVQISTNDGASWNNVGAPVARQNNTNGWVKHTININAYTGAGMSDVRIGLLGISQWGNDMHLDSFAVSAASQCIPLADGGLVIGAVKDSNTGGLVTNATVRDAALTAATIIDASADPAVPARMYVIGQPAGVRVLTATAPSYGAGQASATVIASGTIRQDIQLGSGQLAATPVNLTFNLTTNAPTAMLPLTLSNTGALSAGYEIFMVPGTFAGYAPAGPFAANTRHAGPKNLNDRDASNLRVNLTPNGVVPLAAGEISATLTPGLSSPWGIGFNTESNDFWLGNFDNKVDYRFTTLGVNTGDSIDTASWAVTFAADMTYNPFTNSLWQVNVGGDNCIYELNLATKAASGNKICPAFGTSQRGLAFDPLSNTYFSGSWDDSIINHFAPDGTLLDSKAVGLSISGLAFNPSTGHLFVMTSADTSSDPTKFDVYVLDTKASYAILGGFNLKNGGVNAFSNYAQAALELDCSGNLWAVDQGAKRVYVAPSGESGVCAWQSDWLSIAPASGNVEAGATAILSANVNAAGLAPGTHTAYVRIANDSPYGSVIVPVTLNLTGMNPLNITKSGNGAGTVSSIPGGISCGGDCTAAYPPNTVVRLTALPASGSSFSGWSGDPDCSDGVVTMNSSKSCTATFTVMEYVITESVVGGNGTIHCTSPVTHGNDSICTISPAYGYRLATFTDDGLDVLSTLSGNSYTIHTVTANHLIAGTFVAIPPIRIPVGTLQGAYNTVTDTGAIQAQMYTFTEDVICDRPINVQLKGGYSADYTETSGSTTIEGSLRVRAGKVAASRIYIKKKAGI